MARSKPIEALVRDDWEVPGLEVETGIRAGAKRKKATKRKFDPGGRKRKKRKATKRRPPIEPPGQSR